MHLKKNLTINFEATGRCGNGIVNTPSPHQSVIVALNNQTSRAEYIPSTWPPRCTEV